jgi:hypothetical protein
VSDSIVTRFVNNATVQFNDDYFIIAFFETLQPLLIGSDEDVAKQVEGIESVKAECVGRFVIPASVYPGIVQTIAETLKKHSELKTTRLD